MGTGKVVLIVGGAAVALGGGIYAWSRYKAAPKPAATTPNVQQPFTSSNPYITPQITARPPSSGGGGGGLNIPGLGTVDSNTIKTVANTVETIGSTINTIAGFFNGGSSSGGAEPGTPGWAAYPG